MSSTKWLRALGALLVLGGVAHTIGVARLYAVKGLPDANRILLDVWIAEAQIVGGALFLVGRRTWTTAAAFVVWAWAIPFLPVLVHRAKPIFWVMPILYSALSAAALRSTWREGQ
jgi:hypothetical protein